MTRPLSIAAAFVAVIVSSSVYAADDKAPDWSKYNKITTVSKGVIVKADDNGITLEVPDLEKKAAKFDPNTGQQTQKAGVKPGKKNVDYTYASEALVRWMKMPEKKDDSGKVVQPTSKDIQEAQKPQGVAGFAAERTDLKAGHEVEVHFVVPKDVKNPKDSDYLIKYIFIKGKTTAPTTKKNN